MAAQVRIVFTPVLNALKSGLAQAKNMIQGVLTPLQKPVGPFGGSPFGYVAGAAAGQFANLRDEILNTIDKYRQLQYQVDNWGLSGKNAAKVTAALQTQMESASDALARQFLPNFKEVEAALRAAGYEGGVFGATTEQIERALNQAGKSATGTLGPGITKLGKTLGGSGRRLSWFGFRLLMVGRIFTRFITKTLRKAIQGFTRWDDSITQIGTSMGFLAASGLLTADAQIMMLDAIRDLIQVGPQVGGIMGLVSTLFISMGADIIPIFSGALIDLIMAISEVWEAAKGDLIPIFERLANETIPRFIEILKRVGPEAITGFVQGLDEGITALTDLMEALEPHLPMLSRFLGYLIGIAPVIIAVGMGLFFLSIPMQIVSSLIGIMSGLFGTITGALGVTSLSFVALGAVLLIVAGFIGALIFWWDELVDFWGKTVGPAIGRLFDAFEDLGEMINESGTALDFVKGMTIPFKIALKVIMVVLTLLIDMLTHLIESLTWVGEKMKDVGKWAKDTMGGAGEAVKGFGEKLGDLGDMVWSLFGSGIGDLMAEGYDTARESLENLLETQMNPTVIPQTIPIEIHITIENMSSEIDLDTMTDEVSRKLAGKIEGAFR